MVKMIQKAVFTAKQKSTAGSSGRKEDGSAGPVQVGMTPKNTQSSHPARNAVLSCFLPSGHGHPAAPPHTVPQHSHMSCGCKCSLEAGMDLGTMFL